MKWQNLSGMDVYLLIPEVFKGSELAMVMAGSLIFPTFSSQFMTVILRPAAHRYMQERGSVLQRNGLVLAEILSVADFVGLPL
jgi:hypothetical protein